MSVTLSVVSMLVGLAIPAIAAAQTTDDTAACTGAIPRSEYREVPVFLFATVYEDRARPVLPSADLLSQSVAYRMRTMLGAAEGDIPSADSVMYWGLTDTRVDVILSRDGKFRTGEAFGTEGVVNMRGSPMRLMHQAIQDAFNDAEWLPWPGSLKGDSAVFTLVLLRPRVEKGGRVIPIEARDPVAVFSLWVPWTRPATQLKEPKISYPYKAQRGAAVGGVPLEFVVGQDGKIVMASIREAWPPSVPRPTGDLAEYYTAFKQAVIRGLPTATYSPAVIAGCVVSQKVVQFFEFKFR